MVRKTMTSKARWQSISRKMFLFLSGVWRTLLLAAMWKTMGSVSPNVSHPFPPFRIVLNLKQRSAKKMKLFSSNGLLYKDAEDLFRESSWVQVMVGQGLVPKSFHAMANRISSEQLNNFLSDVKKLIARATNDLPQHQDFIEAHCKADLQ